MTASSSASFRSRREELQGAGPSAGRIHRIPDGFEAGAVAIEMSVLEIDSGAAPGLGLKAHFDLARFREIRLVPHAGVICHAITRRRGGSQTRTEPQSQSVPSVCSL